MIPGATTKIPLQAKRKIFLLLVRQARGSHEHARCAKPTLICLSTEKCLLHRVKFCVAREALESSDIAAFRPKSWNKTAMDRFAVEPHRAGSAVARITPFLDVKPSEFAKECPQALARSRLGAK